MNKVFKATKKPIVITAALFTGDNVCDICDWIEKENKDFNLKIKGANVNFIDIKTLDGVMRADVGDYIVKGISGEFYPCKPDIFNLTYDF